MPQQTFPVTANIPVGYEPTGEYRVPTIGESFLDGSRCCCDAEWRGNCYLILQKVRDFQWPSWIKEGVWIAMDKDGKWWAYEEEPTLPEGSGYSSEFWQGCLNRRIPLTGNLIDFTPPPCTDWRQSKRQKPI